MSVSVWREILQEVICGSNVCGERHFWRIADQSADFVRGGWMVVEVEVVDGAFTEMVDAVDIVTMVGWLSSSSI